MLAQRDRLARRAVAAVATGGRGHQITQATQAVHRVLLAAHGAQVTVHLAQAARDQGRLGVVAQPQAVHHARRERHHVLQHAAQFHARLVGTGVHPQGRGHQGRLHLLRKGRVPAGDDRRGRQAPPDLLGVIRAAQNRHPPEAQAARQDRQLPPVRCQPLGAQHHAQLTRQFGQQVRHAHARHDHQRERRPRHRPREVRRDLQVRGQGHARQVLRVHPLAVQFGRERLTPRPQGHRAVARRVHRQRRAPAARTQHRQALC